MGTCLNTSCKQRVKMNEIFNKFLLAGDKFMPEMNIRQLGFTYSACGPFNKNKEQIQKFKETGDTSYTYKNGIDKACFQHDMAYADFKELKGRTASEKVLRDKAFNIAKNPKYDGYQRGLASMVYNFFTFFGLQKPKMTRQFFEFGHKGLVCFRQTWCSFLLATF